MNMIHVSTSVVSVWRYIMVLLYQVQVKYTKVLGDFWMLGGVRGAVKDMYIV